MELRKAHDYQPPHGWSRIQVVDSHTGGEPFRVVVGGVPEIKGDTVLERRRWATEHLDGFRKMLMWEPRGHADMYGGIIGRAERAGSQLSVLFMHNDGFSTMCGHGIIALAKVVLDLGIIDVPGSVPELHIDTPAGQVMATSRRSGDEIVSTTFRNVPSFAPVLDATVMTDSYGEVKFDIGYGGAFYAYVDAASVGISLDDSAQLVAAGREIKTSVASAELTVHPESSDLSFLYGVIFFEPSASEGVHSRNVCVFANGEIDRSPTGTGVSGRAAILNARGLLDPDESLTIESIVRSRFSVWYREKTNVGSYEAIVPEVTGSAHILGRTDFWIDPSDTVGRGFLLR